MAKKKKIRIVALGVVRQGDKLLLAESYDAVKQETFYRPLGGAIEFGEYGQQTVAREFVAEINEAITDIRYLGTLENVFTFNGQPGHEIIRVYDGVLVNPAVYTREVIERENDHSEFLPARWLPISLFRRGEAILYPTGLLDLLLEKGVF
jgi:8-oxo-dGTP pyrophosphatase MutT (NUDIX family)